LLDAAFELDGGGGLLPGRSPEAPCVNGKGLGRALFYDSEETAIADGSGFDLSFVLQQIPCVFGPFLFQVREAASCLFLAEGTLSGAIIDLAVAVVVFAIGAVFWSGDHGERIEDPISSKADKAPRTAEPFALGARIDTRRIIALTRLLGGAASA